MASSIIGNDAIEGEVFLPGQIFVFGGFALRANSLGHLEQIDSYAPGQQLSICSRWPSELARSAKPPNTNILPGRKTSPRAASLQMMGEAIEPSGDDTVELSMKAPMSVSKPGNLG